MSPRRSKSSRKTLRGPPTLLVAAIAAAALAMPAGLGGAAPASGALKRITFGDSVRGAKLRAVRLGDPDATRKALVVGSIHGDETQGHEIVRRLRRAHRDTPAVQLWVVTSVNPDGVDANTRKNARGVDLNRNFSYRWRGGVPPSSGYYPGAHPFSEPESRAVRRLARRLKPRVTIWYHQPWGQVLAPCHGPARKQKRYARLANLPLKRCRGQRLRGTATSWQNHHLPGTAFVVELPGGELPNSAARRHARAAAKVARSGAGGRHRSPAGGAPNARQATTAAHPSLRRPAIDRDPIPYGRQRRRQMAAYSDRHYGRRRWRLDHPRVIVLHFTAGDSYRSAWETFASNAPSLGELPGVCAHFVVEKRGRIHRLVAPRIRCRHAIGLNHRSLGIEMVQETGRGPHWADRRILQRERQIDAALHLVGWLKQRFGIRMRDIIGHAMADGSPYFKDLQGWQNDHADWLRRDVRTFRHRLRRRL